MMTAEQAMDDAAKEQVAMELIIAHVMNRLEKRLEDFAKAQELWDLMEKLSPAEYSQISIPVTVKQEEPMFEAPKDDSPTARLEKLERRQTKDYMKLLEKTAARCVSIDQEGDWDCNPEWENPDAKRIPIAVILKDICDKLEIKY